MKTQRIIFPYAVWSLLFTVLPLILMFTLAFTDSSERLTIDNFLQVGKYSSVFVRSMWLGGFSTLICFIIGYPVAYFISKIHVKKQGLVLVFMMIPMWMSFLLRTYAWITILENNGLINTFLRSLGLGEIRIINTQWAVIIGMVYNFLPYMVFPIYSVLAKIDTKIIEAAQDLGANKQKVFSKVIFPLSIPGVISGIIMVFVPSVSTFIISKMLGGGSNLLIGDLIEMQFLGTTYNPNLGSAISLVLMVIIMICMGIMNKFDSEEEKRQAIMM